MQLAIGLVLVMFFKGSSISVKESLTFEPPSFYHRPFFGPEKAEASGEWPYRTARGKMNIGHTQISVLHHT
jgi:hypothetical protein